MTATIQDTLLDLFQQVIEDPDCIPAVPTDAWPEDSEQRRLLTGFREMLERIEQSKRRAEQQLREKEEQYRSLIAVSRHVEKALAEMREREALYRNIFEATYDGLVISHLEDGCYVEVNPAFCRMFGYTREEVIGMQSSVLAAALDQHLVAEVLETLKAGRSYQTVVGQVLRKDGTAFYVESQGTPFTYQGRPHVLDVVRDITERVEAERQLREKEEEYRSIFEASIDGLVIIDQENHVVKANPAACQMHGYTREELIGRSASLEIVNVQDVIRAGGRFHSRETGFRKDRTTFYSEVRGLPFTYKGKPHMLGIIRDITEQAEAEAQLREREEQYHSIFEATNDALFIMDLEDGHIVEANPAACNTYGYSYEEFIGLPPSAVIHPNQLPAFREEGLPSLRAGAKRHVQGVNLRKDGSVFPIDLHQSVFTYQGKPHILAVMRDITEQMQAQQLLEQRVEERTRELSTLLEVSHNVASTIDLKLLLDMILDQLKVVVDYTGSAITILEGEDLVLFGTRGPESEEHLVRHRFPLKYMGPIWEALCRGELVVIDNMLNDTPMARAYRETVGDLLETALGYVRSWIAVPLKLKDQVIGILSISHSIPDFYTPHHAELTLAIANQAAVAIENARLYEQAQELAALEERQRLARELHDSVSQALYGISLGAHAARTALEREPGEVAEPLDYVLALAEAALAEMRALIFELRPESLETEGLVSALSKQAAALQARHELVVSTELCDEPDLPLRAKQELYRIAQEAMHNTVKHAHASRIDLRLEQTTGEITLEVGDNGTGFDTTASFPGHLGLRSMRERVTNLGGTFQIESTPGRGTTIRAHVPGRVGAEA